MLDMHRWGLITIGLNRRATRSRAGPRHAAGAAVVADPGARRRPAELQRRVADADPVGRPHPADAMPDSGRGAEVAALNGVPDPAREVLRLRGVALSSAIGPALQAVFSTPRGDVTLTSST
jgi:hypothetical protein